MNSVWKTVKLLSGKPVFQKRSKELLGVIVKHGKNAKTVTVNVKFKTYVRKSSMYFATSTNLMCHDEEEFGRTGDVVVIRSCPKVSERKAYYLRNVVIQNGRPDYWEELQRLEDTNLMKETDHQFQNLKNNWYETNKRKKKTARREHVELRALKIKAMEKAYKKLNKQYN